MEKARAEEPAAKPQAAKLADALKAVRLRAGVAEQEMLPVAKAAVSAAQAAAVGELFQYVIENPVTLASQQSALLPVVNADVKAKKVSIFSESIHAKHPLNGLRLTNTTGLHLMQGPITVFDGGVYAGDAQIAELQPGGERLISYAVDLDIEVEAVAKSVPEQLVSVRLAKGTLIATRELRREKTYNVCNRGDEPREMLLEHPFDPDWVLDELAKPAGRTRDVYHFATTVEAGKLEKLAVAERRRLDQTVILSDLPIEAIKIYLSAETIGPAVRDALGKVVEMRRDLEGTTFELRRRETRVKEIDQEQNRIRQNMERLPQNSDLYGRYVQILTTHEDELASLRKQMTELRERQDEQRKALDDYLLSLDI
jgi:hypothetical protein